MPTISSNSNKQNLVSDDSLLLTELNGSGNSFNANMSDVKNAVAGNVSWIHPRGTAEYAGIGDYAPTQNWAYGTFIQVKSATRVKRIKAYYRQLNVSSTVAPIVEVRVYRSMTLVDIASGVGYPSQSTLVQSNLYYKGQFNTTAGGFQTINLESEITLAANEYLYVYVYAHQGCNVGVRIWNANSSSQPDRQKMWYNTNAANTPTTWFDINSRYQWNAASYVQSMVPFILEADYADNLSTGKADNLNFSLTSIPSIIYVAAGRELNIWNDELFTFGNGLGISVQYTCSKGMIKDRCFSYAPVIGDVGDYTLTITVYDINLKVVGTQTVTIRVVSNASGTGNKNILMIGDSLTFNSASGYSNKPAIVSELINILAADSGISGTFIGKRGLSPSMCEGRPGWSFADFIGTNQTYYTFTLSGVSVAPLATKNVTQAGTVLLVAGNQYTVEDYFPATGVIICIKNSGSGTPSASGTLTKVSGTGDATFSYSGYAAANESPLSDGTRLNIQNYISVNSLATPDVMIVQLGVNDSFGTLLTQRGVDDIANNARKLVDALVDATYGYPSAKIIISLPPFGAAGNNAFGYNYNAAYSPEVYKFNLRRLWTALVAIFANGNYSANVRVAASGLWVDRTNGYPTTTRAISARVATTETINSNGVHPTDSGYQQIADAIYSVLRSFY